MVDNPKKAQGDLKPGAHFFPMSVLRQCFEVMRTGAAKYGLKNWRAQPIRASTYYDAIHRHTTQWFDDREDRDIESQKSHLAHIICCAALVLDSIDKGLLIDDRADTEVLQPQILKEGSDRSPKSPFVDGTYVNPKCKVMPAPVAPLVNDFGC